MKIRMNSVPTPAVMPPAAAVKATPEVVRHDLAREERHLDRRNVHVLLASPQPLPRLLRAGHHVGRDEAAGELGVVPHTGVGQEARNEEENGGDADVRAVPPERAGEASSEPIAGRESPMLAAVEQVVRLTREALQMEAQAAGSRRRRAPAPGPATTIPVEGRELFQLLLGQRGQPASARLLDELPGSDPKPLSGTGPAERLERSCRERRTGGASPPRRAPRGGPPAGSASDAGVARSPGPSLSRPGPSAGAVPPCPEIRGDACSARGRRIAAHRAETLAWATPRRAAQGSRACHGLAPPRCRRRYPPGAGLADGAP